MKKIKIDWFLVSMGVYMILCIFLVTVGFQRIARTMAPEPEIIVREVYVQPKVWQCNLMVTCEWRDWRYGIPREACTYKDTIEYAVENPATKRSYDSWCIEISLPATTPKKDE